MYRDIQALLEEAARVLLLMQFLRPNPGPSDDLTTCVSIELSSRMHIAHNHLL
jgi:hypothetical protein